MKNDAPTRSLLQNMLEEFMAWHASLLQSLIKRQNHPDVIMARKLSDLTLGEWQRVRRQCKMEAKQRLYNGAFLAEQRDSGKRKFDDMSATEQQVLEDFETNKSRKEYDSARAPRLPPFRGKML